MVGHLKCIPRWCIKSFGGQKGVQANKFDLAVSIDEPAYVATK